MATSYKYPFQTGEELKESISQIDISIDLANMQSSLKLAARDLKEIISKEVYDLMMNWYNDEEVLPPQPDPVPDPPNPLSDDQKAWLDDLVDLCQEAIGNLTIYRHLIWLQLRISNNGVTTLKNDNETTAFKYQTDEAKETLLETGYLATSEIIDLLEAHPEFFTQWTSSDQYTSLQKLILKNYKDFNTYYDISGNASFFIRTRFMQQEIVDDHILPRMKLSELDDTIPEGGGDPVPADERLVKLVKRAVAFKTMALAIRRLDYFLLPQGIRKEIGNEFYSSTRFRDIDVVKEKVYGDLDTKGNQYLERLDMYIANSERESDTDNTYEDFVQEFDEDLPFVSMI